MQFFGVRISETSLARVGYESETKDESLKSQPFVFHDQFEMACQRKNFIADTFKYPLIPLRLFRISHSRNVEKFSKECQKFMIKKKIKQ